MTLSLHPLLSDLLYHRNAVVVKGGGIIKICVLLRYKLPVICVVVSLELSAKLPKNPLFNHFLLRLDFHAKWEKNEYFDTELGLSATGRQDDCHTD